MGEYSRRNFPQGSVVGLAAMAGEALCRLRPKGAGSGRRRCQRRYDLTPTRLSGTANTTSWWSASAAAGAVARAMRPKREPECFDRQGPARQRGRQHPLLRPAHCIPRDKRGHEEVLRGPRGGHDLPEDVAGNLLPGGLTETKQMLINDFDVPEENFQHWKDDCSLQRRSRTSFPSTPKSKAAKRSTSSASTAKSRASHLGRPTARKIDSMSDKDRRLVQRAATHLSPKIP